MMSKTAVLVGLVGLASGVHAAINVGVVWGGSPNMTGAGVRDQLNDNTWGYGFNAVILNPGDVDTLAECQAYDCLIFGDAGYNDDGYTPQMFSAVKQYLQGGGGVVTTGFYIYSNGGQGGTDIDFITPANITNYYTYHGNAAVSIVNGGHPVTQGVSNFGPSGFAAEHPNAGGDGGATLLANIDGSGGVYADDTMGGRSVYLGMAYLAAAGYGPANLRSGDADHLFENAVGWASSVPTPASGALLGLGGLVAARRRR